MLLMSYLKSDCVLSAKFTMCVLSKTLHLSHILLDYNSDLPCSTIHDLFFFDKKYKTSTLSLSLQAIYSNGIDCSHSRIFPVCCY